MIKYVEGREKNHLLKISGQGDSYVKSAKDPSGKNRFILESKARRAHQNCLKFNETSAEESLKS